MSRTTHGQTNGGVSTRIYNVWALIKQRCINRKHVFYKHYGGRGISVCEEWLNFEPFQRWALENGYADDLQIDRIDNDGNYEPSNCRFVTRADSVWNRRNTRWLSVDGIKKPINTWLTEFYIYPGTGYFWLKKGEQHFLEKLKQRTGKTATLIDNFEVPQPYTKRKLGAPLAENRADWANVDWCKANSTIARELGVTDSAVFRQREKREKQL